MSDKLHTPTHTLDILNSMQARIAIIDIHGHIIHANEVWIRHARENGDPDSVGANYLEKLRGAESDANGRVKKMLKGIETVLSGENAHYELKYSLHTPAARRWFLLRVTPLKPEASSDDTKPSVESAKSTGVVIMHLDITAQHLNTRSSVRKRLRSRMKQSLVEDSTNQHTREMLSLENMVLDGLTQPQHKLDPITEALISPVPVASQIQLLERYNELLEHALERRFSKAIYDIGNESRVFAHTLGYQIASPRDLIRIHTQVLERKKREMTTPSRVKVCIEEARLLLLEVMGYLTAFYRDLVLADLELTKM